MAFGRVRVFVACVLLVAACDKRRPAPPGTRVDVAPPRVSAQSTDVVFQWLSTSGDIKESTRAADIPPESRAKVRVIPTNGAQPPPGKVFLADMTQQDGKGEIAVRVAPLVEFSPARIARGEEKPPAAAATRAPRTTPSAGTADVILYATSWCGVCEQARSYFRRRKIDYIEKDIEKDPAAAAEMRRKGDEQGVRTSGVPVIDVRGKLLAGFNPEEIERNLARR